MTENPISIIEACFHVGPELLGDEIANLLDKSMPLSDLFEILKRNNLRINKEWVPECDNEAAKQILSDSGAHRIRVVDKRGLEIADFGVIKGGEDDLYELLADLGQVGLNANTLSDLERNF